MITSLRAFWQPLRLAGWMVVATVAALPVQVAVAEECRLPDSAELATFSPEAIKLYGAAIRAIDRIDYLNAYSYLSKASQLQPNAISLNLLTAAVAMKHGRSKSATEARGYYETAITCYRNTLRQPVLGEDSRRDVDNRLRIAVDERDKLAQRDARREGMGGQFVTNLNREYGGATPTPAGGLGAAAAAAPPAGGPFVGAPGASGLPVVSGMPAGMPAGMPPAMPGIPAEPGAMPPALGLPALPAAPFPSTAPAMPAPAPAPAAGGMPMPGASNVSDLTQPPAI